MPAVEIAGGGIAGLISAIMFSRKGWRVTVHEATPALRAKGNGLTIFENGLKVLEAIGLADIDAFGRTLNRFIVRRNTGEMLVEYEPLAATGGRIVMAARQPLIDLLADAAKRAGAELIVGSRIVGAEQSGTLLLASGERRKADLVIGADGVFSSVRKSVLGDLPIGRHRKGAIRLMIPIEKGDFPDGNDRVANEFNHPNGRRAGLYPCSKTEMYFLLVGLLTDEPVQRIPIDPDVWEESFPTLGRYLSRVGALGHYDTYHSISAPTWHVGRCVIIGDAAHGMTPALGQGAGSSMMTAYSLGACDFDSDDPDAVLSRWEAGMRPLIEFTQRFAAGMTAGVLDPKNEIYFSDPRLRPLLTANIPSMAQPRFESASLKI